MNYEKLNDWQLNQVIHNYVECKNEYELNFSVEGMVTWKAKDTGQTYEFNRNGAIKNVNNYFDWSQIMPIAVELNISLVCMSGYWDCHELDDCGDERHNTSDESPQRALVICCIKVLKANK